MPHGDPLRRGPDAEGVDLLGAHGRDRDHGDHGAGLLEDLLQGVEPAEQREPPEVGELQLGVVVEETDRPQPEGGDLLEVTGEGQTRGPGTDDHGGESLGATLVGDLHETASGVDVMATATARQTVSTCRSLSRG